MIPPVRATVTRLKELFVPVHLCLRWPKHRIPDDNLVSWALVSGTEDTDLLALLAGILRVNLLLEAFPAGRYCPSSRRGVVRVMCNTLERLPFDIDTNQEFNSDTTLKEQLWRAHKSRTLSTCDV